MSRQTFSPIQHQVLCRIVAGDTLQQAADTAGVHRNTVLNWRRTSSDFQSAWESIHYERAMHWREQALPLAPLAMDAIRQILEDPATSPALRLRTALAIHKIVSTPPPIQPERNRPVDWDALLHLPALLRQEEEAAAELEAAAEQPTEPAVPTETMHNDAQSATAPLYRATGLVPQLETVPLLKTVHNPAQSAPKTGRNEPCPCESGRKYKHCCLGKTAASAQISELSSAA